MVVVNYRGCSSVMSDLRFLSRVVMDGVRVTGLIFPVGGNESSVVCASGLEGEGQRL